LPSASTSWPPGFTPASGSPSLTFPSTGSEIFTDYLFKGIEEEYGGKWDFVADPMEMAKKMIAHIDSKRKALGIDKARERVLMDMEMRRQLEAAAGEEA